MKINTRKIISIIVVLVIIFGMSTFNCESYAAPTKEQTETEKDKNRTQTSGYTEKDKTLYFIYTDEKGVVKKIKYKSVSKMAGTTQYYEYELDSSDANYKEAKKYGAEESIRKGKEDSLPSYNGSVPLDQSEKDWAKEIEDVEFGYKEKDGTLYYIYTTKEGKKKTIGYHIVTGNYEGEYKQYYELDSSADNYLEALNEYGAELHIAVDKAKNKKSPIYVLPENLAKDKQMEDLDTIIKNADDFVDTGKKDAVIGDDTKVQDLSQSLYNILLTVGIIAAVLVGSIIGIKLMISSVEEKAEYKKYLITYVAGCVIVFSAFGIWKLVVTILQGM